MLLLLLLLTVLKGCTIPTVYTLTSYVCLLSEADPKATAMYDAKLVLWPGCSARSYTLCHHN